MMSTASSLSSTIDDRRALQMVKSARWVTRIALLLALVFIIGPVGVLFVPWQQNIRGAGRVIAFAPLERQQRIDASVDGRIMEVWIQEGEHVSAGDPLLKIADVDPNLVTRLEQEKNAFLAKLEAYEQKVLAYEQQTQNLEATRDLAVAAAGFRVQMASDRVLSGTEAVAAAKAVLKAAELRYERKKTLLAEDIASRQDYEFAERDLEVARTTVKSRDAALNAAKSEKKAVEKELERVRADADAKIQSARAAMNEAKGQVQGALASLAKIDVQLARQASRVITAPRDGFVFRLVANQGGEIVKIGDPLLVLVPETEDRAVELWIDGNDAPLVQQGAAVRLQFEGWPAVQFAGWPSVAVGTFGGKVTLVDSTDDGTGRFRIVVQPDASDPERWPEGRFLRQGVRAKGWVLLNQVSIGYEVWRQLNGFPPVISSTEPKSDIARKRLK